MEMKTSKSAVLVLMFILMLSILVANVVNLINVDSSIVNSESFQKTTDSIDQHSYQAKKYEIGHSFESLMWFLQISDIHISIFRDPSRIIELKEFCDETIDAIKPIVVLASGDLTDAKTSDKMGSRQILEEWQHYKRVLEESHVVNRTVWLDVRGNHDNFNVMNIKSKENYFANYSIQGKKYPRSYMHQVLVGGEIYSFIAIDACLQPGPRRPFNFVGALNEKEVEKIHRLVQTSRANNGDYIIWFGHYPTSCILAQCEGGVRSILGRYREGLAYLCGHYHMFGGVVPNMYTMQHAGFLELELADWKDNRMYRLGAVDHGQFSFVDVNHREWPVALITNPKHAMFAMPQKENLQSIVQSSHIRVLAFSLAPITKVEVKVNNDLWLQCRNVKGPLFVTRWNTSNYLIGVHNIQVRVADSDGRERTVTQSFSLDGTRLSFSVLPRLILMSNVSHIFQFLFGSTLLLLIIPLCILRFMHMLYQEKYREPPRLRIRIFQKLVRKLWILSSIDRLFFPLIFYEVYLAIGPWIIGEVIEDNVGVVFAWGTFVGNKYLPGSFTYAYGFFQLFSFHLPLNLVLAHRIDKRLQYIRKPSAKRFSIIQIISQHLFFVMLILMQAGMAYFFWLAYGTLATILCPLRTWSLIFACILWHQVHRMPKRCMRSAAKLWYKQIVHLL
ncbi:transmembrane protein 62-like [Leptopilina heterotoma]|uniref:transmembrane protein 62-like n=1 Tax=Leptopilina heterotoma TaxID=63436 RepID=UPI001CA83DB1|nr:transmembrane protein 62-like [Leptopilina heterotoma]